MSATRVSIVLIALTTTTVAGFAALSRPVTHPAVARPAVRIVAAPFAPLPASQHMTRASLLCARESSDPKAVVDVGTGGFLSSSAYKFLAFTVIFFGGFAMYGINCILWAFRIMIEKVGLAPKSWNVNKLA